MFGFLNVNKPSGITSHQVISKLRKITGVKQIGHAGTLDPLASGVLPVAIGKTTKLLDYLPSDKAYIVKMEFGKRSDTYDIEGNIEETGYRKVMLVEIEKGLVFQRGKVKQIPPAFSAVHYNGKRLYELAREGKIPEDIPSREITIYENEILNFDFRWTFDSLINSRQTQTPLSICILFRTILNNTRIDKNLLIAHKFGGFILVCHRS